MASIHHHQAVSEMSAEARTLYRQERRASLLAAIMGDYDDKLVLVCARIARTTITDALCVCMHCLMADATAAALQNQNLIIHQTLRLERIKQKWQVH